MKYKKLRQGGIMFASLITIISFIYTINIQPVVIGKQSLIRNCRFTQDSFKFQESNIYKLSPENAFEYKNNLTSLNKDKLTGTNYHFHGLNLSYDFFRSIYIKNVFQKISSNIIKINIFSDLTDLKIEHLES